MGDSVVIELPNHCAGEREYRIEPEDIISAMEGAPEQTVAVWHTHPHGLIGPSAGDMKNRPDASVPMLVVTLTGTGPVPTWF